MNFALDALWWRLQHPDVRALASILTAPPLWHSPCELPVRTLLGEVGFRYLLDLNDDLNFRLPENSHSPLLGKYAENLLAFWLENAPHSELLAQDIVISDEEGRTLGALDFVAKLNERVYHIELCAKYFGSESGLPETLRGLNPNDTLLNKQEKLIKQLQLIQHPAAQKALIHLGVNPQDITSVSVVRGMGFTRSGSLNRAWSGVWVKNPQDIEINEHTRFYRLPKTELLAPARVALAQTQAQPPTESAALIAVLSLRPDGYWHETQRLMFCP